MRFVGVRGWTVTAIDISDVAVCWAREAGLPRVRSLAAISRASIAGSAQWDFEAGHPIQSTICPHVMLPAAPVMALARSDASSAAVVATSPRRGKRFSRVSSRNRAR